jgi:hypothetical protein
MGMMTAPMASRRVHAEGGDVHLGGISKIANRALLVLIAEAHAFDQDATDPLR